MTGHVHFDIAQLLFTTGGVFLMAHAIRALMAYFANHGGGDMAKAIGAFFTLPA